MNENSHPKKSDQRVADFVDQADTPSPSFAREFLDFLVHNKKWWLTPIILMLLLLGILVLLGGSGLSPFIYAVF